MPATLERPSYANAPVGYQPWKPELTLKGFLEGMRVRMETERSSFIDHWAEIAQYVRPRAPRFLVTDVNQGNKRSNKIINSAATSASNVLASGMLSGITSPSRLWFNLKTPDEGLNKLPDVKSWLYDTTERMRVTLGRTNFYQVMQSFFRDMGDFGTAAILAEEDIRKVVKFKNLPIGSYCISRDADGVVRTVTRRFMMQAKQLVDKFGEKTDGKVSNWDCFSLAVQNNMRNGGLEWFEVVHVIMPNTQFIPDRAGPQGKKFLSVYYELGTQGSQLSQTDECYSKYLRVSGYDEFPVFVSVWDRTGEDDYGTSCPGMDTLADIKQLQTMERRGAKALEKMIDPPLQGPSGVTKQKVNMLPGALSVVDSTNGRQAITTLHDTRVDFNQLREDKIWIIKRINENYFKDLFLMMIESDRREITAREVDERSQEKLIVLGPVLEQLNSGTLDPVIDWVFVKMDKYHKILPAPEQLAGMTLPVEYLSINAQAQKALGLSGLDRFARSVIEYAAVDPGIMRAVNSDKLAASWGEFTSLPPGIIRAQDEIDAMRKADQAAQAAQAGAEQAALNSKSAQSLAAAPTDGKNALTDLLKQAQAGAV